jgi:hypothetical protein
VRREEKLPASEKDRRNHHPKGAARNETRDQIQMHEIRSSLPTPKRTLIP